MLFSLLLLVAFFNFLSFFFFSDISGLPEPVQLVLKIIELESKVEEYEQRSKDQEMKNKNLNYELEKTKKDCNFEVSALKKENEFLKEKIDYKVTLETPTKGRMEEKDEQNVDIPQVKELREEIKSLQESLTNVSIAII